MIIAAAGPISNLLQAFVAAAAFRVLFGPITGPVGPLGTALFLAVYVNLLLAFFNLIPVPPLDGGNVLLGLLPPRLAFTYGQLRQYGFIVLYALMFTGLASRWISPPTNFFMRILIP
jgi:Zn-dependent protease